MDLRKQTIVNTSGNIVYLGALWLLTVITAQTLGYDAVGALTLAMAIGNVIAAIQMFGVRSYQSSDMSFHYSPNDYVRARIITVIAGWLVGVIICVVLGYSTQLSITILLFVLVKTSETISDVFFGNDQRVGHLELAGYSMAIRGALLAALFILGVAAFKDLNWSLLITSIGILSLSLLIDLPLHNRIIRNTPKVQDRGLFGIIKDCFPLLIATLIPVIITAFPRIILEHICGSEILGLYGNVSTPALLLTTIAPTVLTALFPSYGRAVKEVDYQSIRRLWIQSIGGTIIITGICMVGVLFFGRPILAIVYTDEIVPFVEYLYFVFFAMMLYTITMCNNTVLVALRKNWGLTFTTFLALAVCLILSVPMIYSWGVGGAIAVLGVSYLSQVSVQVIWILIICKNGDNK